MRGCLRYKTDIGTRRCLTFRQAIYVVIHNNVRNIYIALEGVNGMPHTDSERITVTAGTYNVQILVGQFNTLCIRQGTTVRRMSTVSVEVSADTAGTTDTGNNGQVFRRNVQRSHCIGNSCLYPVMTAARAPVRTNIISVIVSCCHLIKPP